MAKEINIDDILHKQFIAAGDTQNMNGNEGIDATYIVNRRWLNNFSKILVEEVLKLAAEEGKMDFWPDYQSEDSNAGDSTINTDSILNVAKLIKYE